MNTLEKERDELMQALDWILADYEGICRNQFPPSANWEKRILKAHSALRISSQGAAVAFAPQPEKCVICGEGVAVLEVLQHPESGKETNVRSCSSCGLSYVHEDEQPVASVPQDLEEWIDSVATGFDDRGNFTLRASDLRAWMAGHVRVKIEPDLHEVTCVSPGIWESSYACSCGKKFSVLTEDGNAQCPSALITASKESE